MNYEVTLPAFKDYIDSLTADGKTSAEVGFHAFHEGLDAEDLGEALRYAKEKSIKLYFVNDTEDDEEFDPLPDEDERKEFNRQALTD